jgi:hypothetical protein
MFVQEMFMGLGMINDNLEPCPYKIQTSIDASEKVHGFI